MDRQPTYRRSDRVMFYRVGVGGQSGQPIRKPNGWVLHSFSNMRRMLNHSDVGVGCVRQLLVEYHVYINHTSGIMRRLQLLRNLEDVGFRKFYITKNGVAGCSRKVIGFPLRRTKCYEVHYVNVNLMRKSG
ncbi:hypothetical protein ACOMHN_056398 [Nucella lapillus]